MNEELKARFDEIYSPQKDFPSRILEKYEPISCLKHSEGRQVFLFREKDSAKKVIVKCGKAKNGELLKREYDMLCAADPQTAQLFPAPLDYFCEDNLHYYVREYSEGLPLDELVRVRGVLPPMEARAAVAEICGMVQMLHRASPPIICRDLKPENLIVCPDGKYRIIDFDAARYIREDTQHDTTLLGTQDNAAPEQYGYRQSDKRTDVYGLGMLLLFLSSGGYDKNAELPEDIRKIVNRCTEFYPYRRYANAEALRRALLGHGAAAKAGFAVSFAAAGAAIALAVMLCLPKPPTSAEGAPVKSIADNSKPSVTVSTPPTEENAPAVSENTSQTEKPAETESTPQTEKTTTAVTEAPAPTITPEGSVVFAEPRIEKAVRIHLGLSDSDPIGEEDLKKVTSFVLYGDRYFKTYYEYQQFIWDGGWKERSTIPYMEEPLDLVDLTMFENLEAFALINQNADLLPDLSCCPKLKHCVINFCPINDVYGLRNCTELEEFDMSFTPIDDVSPLKGCKKLRIFNVSTTYVEDISAIEGNPLELLGTSRYAHISPQQLASFPNLTNLIISNVDEELLAEISNLKNLITLYVGSEYDFTDMTAFSDMNTLSEVTFDKSENFISLEGVQSLRKLRFLNVSYTAVSELPADIVLPYLEQIDLSYTAVTDFTPLLNCRHLKEVMVSEDMLENAKAQLSAADREITFTIN